MLRIILAFVATFYLSLWGISQKISFSNISTDQGLSTGTVYATYKDSKGFMWFGTRDGLNLFDGYSLTIFKNDSEDTTSISGNYITSIEEGSNGRLWIGTLLNGISIYDWKSASFSRIGTKNGLADEGIYSIVRSSTDLMIIATTNGLSVYDPSTESFKNYFHSPSNPTSISAPTIFSIYEESPTEFWLGCNSGSVDLFDINSGQSTRYTYSPIKSFNDDRKPLTKDRDGNLWVGTDGDGIYILNTNRSDFRKISTEDGLRSPIITSFRLQENEIWIGTDGGGINIYNANTSKFSYIINDPFDPRSLSSDAVYKMYDDDAGLLWVSTFRGGVNYYSPYKQKFDHYKKVPGKDNSLNHNSVIGLTISRDGMVWLGTDGGGLEKFNPESQTFQHYQHNPDDENSISGNVIKCVYEDSNGDLWLGTYAAGLTKYDRTTETFTRYRYDATNPSSIAEDNIWTIIEDEDGDLWIGTLGGGLDLFDPITESFEHFTHDESNNQSISSNTLKLFFLDSQGNFWIGTDDGGLNLFNKNARTFERIQAIPGDPTSLPSNDIRSLTETSSGSFLVGTGNGLVELDRSTKTATYLKVNELLLNKTINGVLEDGSQNLWITTNEGLAKYEPSTHSITHFTKSDGIQGKEFNYTSSAKTQTGAMVFGGTEGFNYFEPDKIELNKYQPKVSLTSFSLFNKPVLHNPTKGINQILKQPIQNLNSVTLDHNQNVFSLTFSSLDFTAPEKNKYFYRLDGFDNNWLETTGNNRTATYMNLSPSTYTFSVRGTNSDGLESSYTSKLQITILPPWWGTWWFRTMAILTLLVLTISFYRWRISSIKHQRERLKEEVNSRTKDLKEVIELIQSNGLKISSTGKTLREKSGKLASDADEQNRNAKDIEREVENVNGHSKKTSENAETSNQISQNTVVQLEKIQQAVLRNVQEIKTISEKISVLEEIFDQTNILAINATIEASKAGESGKGFAVIAGEVRKLAERSNEASKEIVELSSKGLMETEQVEALIQEFIPEVQKSAELIKQISHSSGSQTESVSQVNQSLKRFFHTTEEHTEISNEIHTISTELEGLATYLADQVKKLDLGE